MALTAIQQIGKFPHDAHVLVHVRFRFPQHVAQFLVRFLVHGHLFGKLRREPEVGDPQGGAPGPRSVHHSTVTARRLSNDFD